MNKLFKSIHRCHIGKYQRLDVKVCGKVASWDMNKDTHYLEYSRARDYLESKHPILVKLLKLL